MKLMSKLVVRSAIVLSIVGSAAAASYDDNARACLTKFANVSESAQVMLECTAASGSLTACKVLEDSAPPEKGFDKAALCVAALLPVGSRTGVTRVPIAFTGNK